MKKEKQKKLIKGTQKVKKYGRDLGKRGIYDIRNKLNDLTGREWLSFLTSVWISQTKMDKIGKIHPATFSYLDIEKLILLFTKKGMVVLDPMVGVASTLIACGKTKRKGIGIDLNKDYIVLGKRRLKEFRLRKNQQLIYGDALEKIDTLNTIDYCVTSPPYHNILRNNGNGVRHDKSQLRQGIKYYGEEANDLGNQKTYINYLNLFKKIMEKVYEKLKPNRYCSIIISDFTVNKKERDASGDIIKLMEEISFLFKGRITLAQNQKNIYPFGYPYGYVMNHTNQYILNFKKNGK